MVTTNVEEVMEEEDPHGKKRKKSKVNHQIKFKWSICFIFQRSTFIVNDIEVLKHTIVYGSGDKKTTTLRHFTEPSHDT